MNEDLIARIDERTEYIVKRVDSIDRKLTAQNSRLDEHGQRIARLEKGQSIIAAMQSAFTVIAAGVAGWIGLQR